MKLENLHEILFILNVLIVQIAVKPVASSLSYENKDFVKIKQDPTRFQQASAYRNKKQLFATRYLNVTTSRENNNVHAFLTSRIAPMGVSRNYSQEKNNIGHINDKTVTQPSHFKKWQVGRVSRKQYEIINMLWRKTKIFVNLEQTTANYRPKRDNETAKGIDNLSALRQSFPRFPSRLNLPSTTSSYIEFYYLDETDERGKDYTTPTSTVSKNIREHQLRNHGKFQFVLADSPMFAFRIDDPNYKRTPTRYMPLTNRMRRGKTRPHDSSLTGFSLNSITPSYKFPRKRTQLNKIITTTKSNLKENITLNVITNTFTSGYTIDHQNISSSKYTIDPQNISTSNYTMDPQNISTSDYTIGSQNISTSEYTIGSQNISTSEYIIGSLNISTSEYTIDDETCPITTEALTTFNDTSESEHLNSHSITVTHDTEPTTAYDKIKFFEMYDKLTPIPYDDVKGKFMDINNVEIYVKGNDIHNERQILLEHVDQGIGNEHSNPHKVKHSKKHIIDNYKTELKGQSNDNSVDKKVSEKPTMLNISRKLINVTKQPVKKLLRPVSKVSNITYHKKSITAQWSQYPFAASYVYEPSQVHCDAAAISFHWIVTSGSCLSRHHKNPGGEGRSAFVTYCGESWWRPERVAYVKYSLVHPGYHPQDRIRRHLYNIGLVQVVTSMASACSGWQPISLMSHQFIADVEGSIGIAVGWGLDRFDTRYSIVDLPKSPLMSYHSQVFSDSCPGNYGYRRAKSFGETGIKNVYCLSLPPYAGEETDPVHGGLLLVGGKLVALYLQEERRPWGYQSAQYIGTWRLVPWVLDVARESEESDSFTLDI